MIDNSHVVLENQVKYDVIDKIEYNGIYFVYLSNPEDIQDFCCRKEREENDQTFLVGLSNQEEANLALELFTKKHEND